MCNYVDEVEIPGSPQVVVIFNCLLWVQYEVKSFSCFKLFDGRSHLLNRGGPAEKSRRILITS